MVFAEGDGVSGLEEAVPELAGDLPVAAVETFAVICEGAAADLLSPALLHLEEPVGVGEALAGGGDEIGLSHLQDVLGLAEAANTPGGDDASLRIYGLEAGADLRGQGDVAGPGSGRADAGGRHALLAALAGVWVGGFPHPWGLGVFELAALGDGDEIQARPGEGFGVLAGVLDAAPSGDDLVPQHAAAQTEILPHLLADGFDDLQGEAKAGLGTAPIAIVPFIRPGKELRHGVGVGVVQLHAVEACLLGPGGGLGKKGRQGLGKVSDPGEVEVIDALPRAIDQVLEFVGLENLGPKLLGLGGQPSPQLPLGEPRGFRLQVLEPPPVPGPKLEEAFKVDPRLLPPPNAQEVEDLDEEFGLASTLPSHPFDDLG